MMIAKETLVEKIKPVSVGSRIFHLIEGEGLYFHCSC